LDQPKRLTLGVLNRQLQAMSARCVGFVLMPDHVHALIWLPEPRELVRFLYMRLNPVHAGLVERAEEWRWSSARWHLHQRSVGVPISWING
ncbi:MAG: hypothetical protein IT424_02405, partial [Pirellulales bacterium]|nr:hypothetical protein [Pirellulales bacterium]